MRRTWSPAGVGIGVMVLALGVSLAVPAVAPVSEASAATAHVSVAPSAAAAFTPPPCGNVTPPTTTRAAGTWPIPRSSTRRARTTRPRPAMPWATTSPLWCRAPPTPATGRMKARHLNEADVEPGRSRHRRDGPRAGRVARRSGGRPRHGGLCAPRRTSPWHRAPRRRSPPRPAATAPPPTTTKEAGTRPIPRSSTRRARTTRSRPATRSATTSPLWCRAPPTPATGRTRTSATGPRRSRTRHRGSRRTRKPRRESSTTTVTGSCSTTPPRPGTRPTPASTASPWPRLRPSPPPTSSSVTCRTAPSSASRRDRSIHSRTSIRVRASRTWSGSRTTVARRHRPTSGHSSSTRPARASPPGPRPRCS